jgi:hypothetical protein
VVVEVRNLAGAEWTEAWSREKLAYFILMSEAPDPKFESCASLEWVPYDTNSYRWDKRNLDQNEFEHIAATWPGRSPIPFEPAACDWVQFSFHSDEGPAGSGFNPHSNRELFDALVSLGTKEIRYEAFDYARARHVFELECDKRVRDHLTSENASGLERVGHQLFVAMRDRPNTKMTVRFLLREGSFEPPISLWFES